MNTLQSGTHKAPKDQLAHHFAYLFGSNATPNDFKAHKDGRKELLLNVKGGGGCTFGWIKPKANGAHIDAVVLAQRIKDLKLPLIIISSDDGTTGRLWWFGVDKPVGMVRDMLKEWAEKLKLDGAAIFPEACTCSTSTGNGTHVMCTCSSTTGAPYFGGTQAKIAEFVKHAMALREDDANWNADWQGTRVDDSGPAISDDSAAQILVPHWISGQRDEIGTAVVNILLRRGFPVERVGALINYVAVSAGDEEIDDRLHPRYGLVRKVQDGIAKNRHLYGVPTLKKYIGNIETGRFLEACGITQIADVLKLFEGADEEEEKPIELLAFTLEELDAPLREEKYLIEGLIPTDAYSLIAGALGSYKTFYLIYLMIRRATGYDLLSTLLDFDDEPIYGDAGPCVLLTYEDVDWRIADRIKRIAQYGYELLTKRHGAACADRFKADITKNLRRVPLSGKFDKTIIVRGESGIIIPNMPFIDEVFEKVRAFTADSVMLGLDPLRLAILGSQNDDEIAQVGVTVLNLFATGINKDSGVVALSHANKEGSRNKPNGGYIEASTHTSGSVVWSQHARSNFSTARLPANNETKKLFGDEVSVIDIEKQRVMELTHGRLSHGAEDETRYLLMDGGVLLPIEVAKERTYSEEIDAALPVVARVIDKLIAIGARASKTNLRDEAEVKAALGSDPNIRSTLNKLEGKGFVEFPGATTKATGAITPKGRERLRDLERAAKFHHESSRVAGRERK